MADQITQTQLDGLVTVAELPRAVGYTNAKEKEASVKGTFFRTFRVVEAAKIAETRTKKATKDEGKFLTVENARAVLPPSYSAREIDGDVYPALHHPPTVEIRGYLPEQVATLKALLNEYREEKERQREARSSVRNALLQRWLSGDEHVAIHFTDTDVRSAPRDESGNVIGEIQFGKREFSEREAAQFEGSRAGEVAVLDWDTGRWIPQTACHDSLR